jgi:hypothetical protein
MSQTRRLAAILAADVAGYSRLIGADEGGTLDRLRVLRRELLDPKIAENKGRLVKTTGDGLLIEFGSVVDALRCAVEVQREMIGRNAGVSPDDRIEFRIGINVGDAVVEDARPVRVYRIPIAEHRPADRHGASTPGTSICAPSLSFTDLSARGCARPLRCCSARSGLTPPMPRLLH